MTTRQLWAVTAAAVTAGIVLLVAGDGPWYRFLGSLLTVVPLGLAVNITTARRRRARREDAADSVELHAAGSARAAAYVDTLVLGAFLLLALAALPQVAPAIWGGVFLSLAVCAFWVRYALTLRHLRG